MLLLMRDKAKTIVGTMLRNGLVAEGGGDRRSALINTKFNAVTAVTHQ